MINKLSKFSLKITTLGAAKEVGRSAFLINSNNTNILLDYGVLIEEENLFFRFM